MTSPVAAAESLTLTRHGTPHGLTDESRLGAHLTEMDDDGVGKLRHAVMQYPGREVGEQQADIAPEARLAVLPHRETNSEIGARLFLSPRTVEWHRRKVFMKLDIQSRLQRSGALPSSDSELVPA